MKRSAKFNWLIMSNQKDDVRIIDADSDMWGCLSYFDKVKLEAGSHIMLNRDGKLCCYSILLQGMDDFSSELEVLKRITKPLKTVEPVTVENCSAVSEVSSGNCLNQQSSSNLRRELLSRYDYLLLASLKS